MCLAILEEGRGGTRITRSWTEGAYDADRVWEWLLELEMLSAERLADF